MNRVIEIILIETENCIPCRIMGKRIMDIDQRISTYKGYALEVRKKSASICQDEIERFSLRKAPALLLINKENKKEAICTGLCDFLQIEKMLNEVIEP